MKEARRLRQMAHPHVVELRTVFTDGVRVGWLELEFCALGDLWQWLVVDADMGELRTRADRVRVLRLALCGMRHVHRCGVVKSECVLSTRTAWPSSVTLRRVSKDDATRVTDSQRCAMAQWLALRCSTWRPRWRRVARRRVPATSMRLGSLRLTCCVARSVPTPVIWLIRVSSMAPMCTR